ncbi:MAG: septum formation initiator family protein [bacterium]|nr:septum formation initiator family protein [bacterium]
MLKLLNLVLVCCRPAALVKWAVYLLVVAAIWIYFNRATLQAYFAARERYNAYRAEVAAQEKQQARLNAELKALKAGGFPAEKAIRERLFMVRPGEKIIFVDPPGGKAGSDAAGHHAGAAESKTTDAAPPNVPPSAPDPSLRSRATPTTAGDE